MEKRTSILLAVLTMVFLAGAGREAQASNPCYTQCYDTCKAACTARGSTCSAYYPEPWPGDLCSGTCGYSCADGYAGNMYCSCGGGSPIFRKFPTAHTKTGSKQPAKPVQAAKPAQPAKPVLPTKPVQPAPASPAQNEGSPRN